VNFAFMTSVLADLQSEDRKYRNNHHVATGSMIIAFLSTIMAALAIIYGKP
jgi:hypothetical protein